MKKKNSMKKKRNFKPLYIVAGIAAVGAVATAGVLALSNGGDVIIQSGDPISTSVTLNAFDVETKVATVGQEAIVKPIGTNTYITLENGVEKTGFYAEDNFEIFLLDTDSYGSDAVLGNDMAGVTVSGEGFNFKTSQYVTTLNLGVNKISDFEIKAEDNIESTELFVGTSIAYQSADALQFDSDNAGAVISTASGDIDVTLFLKPSEKEAVANDNGMLIVVDSSSDELEDESVVFKGSPLTLISREKLKTDYSEATYEAFKTKDVYFVSEETAMEYKSENELKYSATVIEGVTVSKDVVISTYALGHIKTADGIQLTAVKADASALHPDVDKAITLNLA